MVTWLKTLLYDPAAFFMAVHQSVNSLRALVFAIGAGLQTGLIPNPFPKDTWGWYAGLLCMAASVALKSGDKNKTLSELLSEATPEDLARVQSALAAKLQKAAAPLLLLFCLGLTGCAALATKPQDLTENQQIAVDLAQGEAEALCVFAGRYLKDDKQQIFMLALHDAQVFIQENSSQTITELIINGELGKKNPYLGLFLTPIVTVTKRYPILDQTSVVYLVLRSTVDNCMAALAK